MAFYKGTTHNVIIFLFREGIVPVAPTPGALLTPRIRHTAQIHVIICCNFNAGHWAGPMLCMHVVKIFLARTCVSASLLATPILVLQYVNFLSHIQYLYPGIQRPMLLK